MAKYNYIIGIDPDCDKSGVAFLETNSKKLELSNLTFAQLLDYMLSIKNKQWITGETGLLVVEAGYLNKSNWHVTGKDNSRVATAKGNSAGRNHEVARKIIEMARHYGLEVIEARPLKKCWKGPAGKITHDELAYFTGISGRTNQETRDSALLAWNYAGFSMRVKPVVMGTFFKKK